MKADYEKNMYNQLMDVMSRLDSFEKKHKEGTEKLKAEIARLSTENTNLKHENEVLKNEIERLKSIINNDSTNTSLPPSTDQKGAKPSNCHNGREKTGRKAGGQEGHKGATLTRKDIEEKIKSGNCRHEIKQIGDVSNGKYITKYILDLDVTCLITELRIYADSNGRYSIPPEYRSDVVYGDNVKALATMLYSEGVMSNDRIADFLNAASDGELKLSTGSIYQFCKSLANKSEASIGHLEEELLNQRVVATDATVMSNNGNTCYVRNFSVAETVIYRAMKQKNLKCLHKIRFLERFSGILLHDHETALYQFGTGHAECNVHIIRYLRKNTEDTKNAWSEEMIGLLCEANNKRKDLISAGQKGFPEEEIKCFENRYRELLKAGREQNKKTKHMYAKSQERTLLNRMEKYSQNHLLFLHDFEIPFHNNMSERDLRKAKNRQKMAGGF